MLNGKITLTFVVLLQSRSKHEDPEHLKLKQRAKDVSIV